MSAVLKMGLKRKCILMIFVILCDLRISSGQVSGSGTVLRVIQNTQGLGKFGELLVKADLTTLFNTKGQYTIFAPNNTAFDNLPYEKRREIDSLPQKQLRNFIKFHALMNKMLMTGNMRDNEVFDSMADNGERIFINRRKLRNTFGPTMFFVNGAEISEDQRDLPGTNGVVHGLARFIGMTSQSMAYGYIASPDDDTIRTGEFYDLISQYLQDGYYSTLYVLSNRNKKVTFLVPNDAAMKKIPPAKLDFLRQNPRELDRVVKAHIIPDRVIFTPYVNHNEGFNSLLGPLVRFRRPYGYDTFVNSDGVDAEIIRGNITVDNGVIHVVDQLLSYVYFNVRETIERESNTFNNYLNNADVTIRNTLVQASGVNVFVPTADAFNRIQNVPGVNLVTDLRTVDRMLRLHILRSFQDLEISSVIGGYESRQYRQTLYDGWNVTVYNDRNESWVQAGYVKARVVRPDLKATNGRVHIIDSVLGIPYLDLPMLICHDLWLLRTYDYIRSVGMKKYITDQRFVSKQCDFELYGYPPGYDYGGTYGSNYGNSNYGNNNYGNNYQQTTYNPYGQQNNGLVSSNQVSPYDMGICSGCEFTFFVPNSTAIDYFQRTPTGIKIMRESQRLQYLFKRLLFQRKIPLGSLSNTNHIFTAMTGESIRILKTRDRDVKIQFSGKTANVISMDLGATNGLMHIIDQIIYVPEDVTRDVSRSCNLSYSITVLCIMSFFSLFLQKYLR